ncbi:MAG: aminoacyl-tRNA hydrolase [Oscillospiraceae bacterium]|jgi:PTH1 family peptidyl-tRNA hydrolase|nr:aminoacyl-tRNA hydrolase [Oscillospiraceae bacterium]
MEWLAAFLGNPGRKYAHTRHNIGFLTGDIVARRLGVRFKKLRFGGVCAESGNVLLLKPQLYMNCSGQSVCAASAHYRLPPERVLAVYDDVSLPPGKLRVRKGGGSGGHNGVKDIITRMGSEGFPRVRIGIGAKPRPDIELIDWVLGVLTKEERAVLDTALPLAASAVLAVFADGVEAAMNTYNSC